MYLKLIGKGILQMVLGALSLALILKALSTEQVGYMIASILPLACGIIMQAKLIEELKVIVAECIIDDMFRT